MIRIERRRGPSPYNPNILTRGKVKLAEYFALEPLRRTQQTDPVRQERDLLRREILLALNDFFQGKCAYCELRVDVTTRFEIDEFRPRFGASNLDGAASAEHYCWLSLEWENHFAACPACNRAKRSLFPVDGPRADYGEDPAQERALLINPCEEDPGDHLEFIEDGTVQARSDRGVATIRVLNLNRTVLVEDRRQVFLRTLEEIERGRPPSVAELIAAGEPYIATVKAALASAAATKAAQPPSLVVPEETRSAEQIMSEDVESFRLNARALQSVHIENFRLIRKMSIRFPEPTGTGAPWLMLLGENASGKSTVLQAIGLALAGAREAGRFARPSKVVTRGAAAGHVTLHFWDNPVPVELGFNRHDREFVGTIGPSAIVLGYGALRYLARRRTRRHKVAGFTRLEPLLEPVARIDHPSAWFASLSPDRFQVAAKCMRELLPIADDVDVVRRGRRVVFQIGAYVSSLEELSAGYQTMVGVSANIMQFLFEIWQTLDSAAAIVLIDELDAHLHPRWKMRIVRALREAFPQVQFITSTHDPLVLRGIRNGEVAVLQRDDVLGTAIEQELPPVEGMQVDALLTSRHFGLQSTLDPVLENKLAELYHLQSLPRTTQTDERIRALREEIGDKVELGRSRREQMMLRATDEFLRSTEDPDTAEARQELSRATARRLQALIDGTRGGAS
jgi:uncharacterized protein (TIGR02646 family)